jgi:peptide/nickel transport system substrate-binding protein
MVFLAVLVLLAGAPAGAQPSGTVTVAAHVTLATRWLDPAETDAEITPFMIFYALHDALVKPMPQSLNAPSLAESWTCRRTAAPGSSCSARASSSTTAIRSPPRT